MVVAHQPSDAPAPDPDDLVARQRASAARASTPRTYPGLSLQVVDLDATTRWQRGRRPEGRRFAASLAVWTESGDDVRRGDADRRRRVARPRRVRGDGDGPALAHGSRRRARSSRDPGVLVTSLLHRAPSMTRDEFVAHWRDVHQPMSLRIHPQHTYVRNLVTRVVAPGVAAVRCRSARRGSHRSTTCWTARASSAPTSPSTTWQRERDDHRRRHPAASSTSGHTVATIIREYRLREFR